MHAKWQNQLPFYLNGTLPPHERAALEHHLATCAACRRALDEWLAVGELVNRQAADWARQTPHRAPAAGPYPSANGRRQARPPFDPDQTIRTTPHQFQHIAARKRQTRRRSRFPLPAPLAAAAAIVIVIGVIVFALGRGDNDSLQSGTGGGSRTPTVHGTQSPTPPPSLEVSAGGGPTPVTPFGPTATRTRSDDSWDLGILPAQSATPWPSVPPFATTPPPPWPTVAASSMPYSSPTQPGGITYASPSPYVCNVSNPGEHPVEIHRFPNELSLVTGQILPGQFLLSHVMSADGWYEVFESGPGLLGWVQADSVEPYGPCGTLPQPTPTQSPESPGACPVTTARFDVVDVYAGPGDRYDVLGGFGSGTLVQAIAVSDDDQWTRVWYTSFGVTWIGWARDRDLFFFYPCDLPVLLAADQLPEPAPTRRGPTPFHTSTLLPTPTVAILTATPLTLATFDGGAVGVAFDYPPAWYLTTITVENGPQVRLTTHLEPPHKQLQVEMGYLAMSFTYVVNAPANLDTWVAAERDRWIDYSLQIYSEEPISLPNGITGVRMELVSGSGGMVDMIYAYFNGRPIEIYLEGDFRRADAILATLRAAS